MFFRETLRGIPLPTRQAQRRRGGHPRGHTRLCAGWRLRLIRPTGSSRKVLYPRPGKRSAAGEEPPALYPPLCRMALRLSGLREDPVSPYTPGPASAAPPSNKRQAAYLTPSAWPRTPGCCSAPAKPPASGPGTAKQPASGSHPPALHAPQSRHR